jgi:hypothetical protein
MAQEIVIYTIIIFINESRDLNHYLYIR